MPPTEIVARDYNAQYYDLVTRQTDDIDFYRPFLKPTTRVLELGCGTGRVSRELTPLCRHYVGIDMSPAMLERARQNHPEGRYELGDMTSIELNRRFDLILAPFRVIQCLEENSQVDGLFRVLRRHIEPNGLIILNAFRPNAKPEEVGRNWPLGQEVLREECVLDNGDLLKVYDVRRSVDVENQVAYIDLIYRRYSDRTLVDTHVNPICMRYWYPDEFLNLIQDSGFSIVDTWGGYEGEPYESGSELVVAFRPAQP